MAEHQIETTSNDTDTHDADCAFVCALLNQYPCAAYEAYKNAPATIQADIDVAQKRWPRAVGQISGFFK